MKEICNFEEIKDVKIITPISRKIESIENELEDIKQKIEKSKENYGSQNDLWKLQNVEKKLKEKVCKFIQKQKKKNCFTFKCRKLD
jgi:hypothetical protein